MDFFTVGKIALYCESIAHRIEGRSSGQTKVVDLALKVEPFTNQLAAAMDDEYAHVKRLLFKLGDGSPVRDMRSIEFRPPFERQNLIVFATPDTTEPSICLPQAKITKLRARSKKDGDGWVLYLYVSFGPVSKTELEFVNDWYTQQRFVTFEQAEPSLEFEDEDGERLTESDEKARQAAPMFDDQGDETPDEDSEATTQAKRAAPAARQRLHSHAQGKKKANRRARAEA